MNTSGDRHVRVVFFPEQTRFLSADGTDGRLRLCKALPLRRLPLYINPPSLAPSLARLSTPVREGGGGGEEVRKLQEAKEKKKKL